MKTMFIAQRNPHLHLELVPSFMSPATKQHRIPLAGVGANHDIVGKLFPQNMLSEPNKYK